MHTTLLGLLGHPVTLIRSLGHFRIPVPRDCLPWMRHYARSNTASAAYRKCYFVLWFRSIRNQARLHGVDNANTKLLRGRAGQVGLARRLADPGFMGRPVTRRGVERLAAGPPPAVMQPSCHLRTPTTDLAACRTFGYRSMPNAAQTLTSMIPSCNWAMAWQKLSLP